MDNTQTILQALKVLVELNDSREGIQIRSPQLPKLPAHYRQVVDWGLAKVAERGLHQYYLVIKKHLPFNWTVEDLVPRLFLALAKKTRISFDPDGEIHRNYGEEDLRVPPVMSWTRQDFWCLPDPKSPKFPIMEASAAIAKLLDWKVVWVDWETNQFRLNRVFWWMVADHTVVRDALAKFGQALSGVEIRLSADNPSEDCRLLMRTQLASCLPTGERDERRRNLMKLRPLKTVFGGADPLDRLINTYLMCEKGIPLLEAESHEWELVFLKEVGVVKVYDAQWRWKYQYQLEEV